MLILVEKSCFLGPRQLVWWKVNIPFQGGDILNNGHNRISCFVCDYDICDSCVHRRIYVLSKCLLPMPDNSNTNQQLNSVTAMPKFCNLELDIYPIVPPDYSMWLKSSSLMVKSFVFFSSQELNSAPDSYSPDSIPQ